MIISFTQKNDNSVSRVRNLVADLSESTNDNYFNIDAFSAHSSRLLITDPIKWKNKVETISPALVFGSAFHYALLNSVNDVGEFVPQIFDKKFAVIPEEINARTNAGKEFLRDFHAKCEAEGKTILSSADFQLINAMRDKLLSSERGKIFLGIVKNKNLSVYKEVPLFWDYQTDFGDFIKCKAKCDILIHNPQDNTIYIVDLKTTTSATPEEFTKSIVNFGYAWQSAWYSLPFSELGYKIIFYCFAVEKNKNADFGIYNINRFSKIETPNVIEFLENSKDLVNNALRNNEYNVFGNKSNSLNPPSWFKGTRIPSSAEKRIDTNIEY